MPQNKKSGFGVMSYNKYGVSSKEARTLDGITFDSKWELKVYSWLKSRLVDATIELQPKYVLQDKFVSFDGTKCREIAYFADFLIRPKDSQNFIVVDAKGLLTPDFKLKFKLFLYKYKDIPLYLPKNEKQLKQIPWEKHGIKLKYV
jgi:hypothetical protein